MTTNSQLSATEAKKTKKQKKNPYQTNRTKSQKWRSHGGLSATGGDWEESTGIKKHNW